MGFITKYGGIWGQVPATAGNVYWVAPAAAYTVEGRSYSASNDNDGLSPERALSTAQQAVTNATASAGDIIVLLPGAHSWSASLAMSKAGIVLTGLNGEGLGHPGFHKTSITTSAADEIINVTAADCVISHLRVIPVTAQRGIDFTAAGDRLYIHHCSFDMYTAAVNTGTIAIGATTGVINVDRLCIRNNIFESDGAQGPAIDVGDSNMCDVRDNDIIVTGAVTWASAVTVSSITTQTGMWINNRFIALAGATLTDGMTGGNMTSTNALYLEGNFASVGVVQMFDDFPAGDVSVVENYMSSGGGTGANYILSGGFLETRVA